MLTRRDATVSLEDAFNAVLTSNAVELVARFVSGPSPPTPRELAPQNSLRCVLRLLA